MSVAEALAGWAASFVPEEADLELADLALVDTVAVAMAARESGPSRFAGLLGEAGGWAMLAHQLDYDDLHIESTTHISAVCVPAALGGGGDATSYLVGAGVMARLGGMLGWSHYQGGWHATCTAGAPAAAAAAAHARGLDADQIATAIALAVPGAGGVQRAFGTDGKALQVGFAVESGMRAAALAGAGATADLGALDQWLGLVGGAAAPLYERPAIAGGLALKVFPCCYALQRPIEAMQKAIDGAMIAPSAVESILVRAPESAVTPLIHHRPKTGLEAKFSLEYAVLSALFDLHPGLRSFSDAAVNRPEAQRLLERVEFEPDGAGGDGLMAGEVTVELRLTDGSEMSAAVDWPAGSPRNPLSRSDLAIKVADCCGELAPAVNSAGWADAGELARALLSDPGRG